MVELYFTSLFTFICHAFELLVLIAFFLFGLQHGINFIRAILKIGRRDDD
ncbi:MAG TPA: hypothetical protein VKB38_13150 [Terracidiphilus sp.]|nr:hypothetical protein [Terracidiphilus sp.]